MTARLLWTIVFASALGPFVTAVAGEPLNVCVVAERPGWSFRYLTDTLRRDADLNVTSLTINVREPIVPELKNCSVLILVDVSPQAIRAQPEIVDRAADFVARGGGLIIAAGESWRGEEFPLAKLLPIQFDDGKLDAKGAPVLSRPSITGDGLRSPILRLVDDPMQNQQLWREGLDASFGEPLSVVPLREATVLAVDPKRRLDGQEVPLIATREVGNGRVIFLNNCQAWRWRVKPVGNYHGRFWKQLTQFAAGDE